MTSLKTTYRTLILINIALSALFIMVQTLVLMWFGISPLNSLLDSAVSNLLLAAICYNAGNILRYYRPGKNRFLYVFIWDLAISGVWLIAINWILSSIITDASYLLLLAKSLPVRYFVAFLITGWFSMISWVIYSNEEQQQNEKRKTEAEKLTREAELFKLRKQLHPHFLFNSLNSISSLTISRPEEARLMVQQLADFLRGTLKNEEELQVTLEEELRLLQLYLDIEKVRFGHRLDTLIEKDETCLSGKIPQLLLQPVVENAIKFGLYDTTEKVLIKITAKKADHLLSVSVQNPFDPASASS
ncbi:MAG TPA: histidine kinase, partial [Bacteroidia bacterium]|nr:histidine kinase [Bacteroidia bacterium]